MGGGGADGFVRGRAHRAGLAGRADGRSLRLPPADADCGGADGAGRLDGGAVHVDGPRLILRDVRGGQPGRGRCELRDDRDSAHREPHRRRCHRTQTRFQLAGGGARPFQRGGAGAGGGLDRPGRVSQRLHRADAAALGEPVVGQAGAGGSTDAARRPRPPERFMGSAQGPRSAALAAGQLAALVQLGCARLRGADPGA